MKWTDVPKRARNAIEANIKKLSKKYGDNNVRLVTQRYWLNFLEQNRLQKEIKRKERELEVLKKTRR